MGLTCPLLLAVSLVAQVSGHPRDGVCDGCGVAELSVDFYVPEVHNATEGVLRHLVTKRAGTRPGSAHTSNSCNLVRGVPGDLRSASVMKPSGVSSFYTKYTETYGIPVLGSSRVSDSALQRACYTLRFALADRADIRNSFYSYSGRVALIARSERTTQMPEYSYLPSSWDTRARGFGGTVAIPLSLGAEENVLCDGSDPWHKEDIFLHELSHGIDNLGAKLVVSGWDGRRNTAYSQATAAGKWANTYAGSNKIEYFAEGVVTYFNDQEEDIPTNGIHNYVNTRSELYDYDKGLYGIVSELFPCGNTYLKRCQSSRGQEQAQSLRMDCAGGSGGTSGGSGSTGGGSGSCSDSNENCGYWSQNGYCNSNAAYMNLNCRKSCGKCGGSSSGSSTGGGGGGACTDDNQYCSDWSRQGYCTSNAAYMTVNCRQSCGTCGGGGGATCTDSNENCAYWSQHGYCTSNAAYMSTNCKHSCGTCGGQVGR